MRVCVITDNDFLFTNILGIFENSKHEIQFYYSAFNQLFVEKYKGNDKFKPINLRNVDDDFFDQYDMFFSMHCKQLFPQNMVTNHRCINVHPGFNPYNRGWFPQVFSILNKKPIGVTIHEMDSKLDHGPIIYQEKIVIESYDTSFDIYRKIQNLEIEMIEKYLDDLITGNYVASEMNDEGNLNYKKDFSNLCKIDLKQQGTFEEFLDILRATTFAGYDNAFFIDGKGNKIYVAVALKKDC